MCVCVCFVVVDWPLFQIAWAHDCSERTYYILYIPIPMKEARQRQRQRGIISIPVRDNSIEVQSVGAGGATICSPFQVQVMLPRGIYRRISIYYLRFRSTSRRAHQNRPQNTSRISGNPQLAALRVDRQQAQFYVCI